MNAREYFVKRDELIFILNDALGIVGSIERNFSVINEINKLKLKLSSDSVIYNKTIEKAIGLFDIMRTDLIKFRDNPNESVYLRDFLSVINDLNAISTIENPIRFGDYNSEKYYTEQIKGLKDKEEKLNDEIKGLKQNITEKEEKEKELEIVQERIRQSEEEKDELLKKLDAQNNMQIRISKVFSELKKCISPLQEEKTRLNRMFYAYAILCGVVFLVLVYFEGRYLNQWEGAKKWIDYLPFYVPLPIVGGLLWAFIFQMNRAQRQLMQVANVLYHIDYVEGLLLAINLVSSDVNSASEKIRDVLDKMISNYMSTSDSLSEKTIDAEISKDNINLHTFINLAKEIKEVIK